jgi:hypothetical protein
VGKKKRLKCNCSHIGNCMMWERADPLQMTYLDGSPIYRAPVGDERGRRVADAQAGDAIGQGRNGPVVTAVALDPERAVKFAKRLVKKQCKADSSWWRLRHPLPTPAEEEADA